VRCGSHEVVFIRFHSYDEIEIKTTLYEVNTNTDVHIQLLMTIIRYVMPIDDHKIKKLLLLYWEIVDKTTPEGKLLDVFILVW
jgi:coatomer subunit beta